MSLDQYHESSPPPAGWERWTEQQVQRAAFTLVVCTAEYYAAFDDQNPAGIRRGVRAEAQVIRQFLYDGNQHNTRFIAVLFEDVGEACIPMRLRSQPVYERLRDVRETAVTQGRIAGILVAKGELEAALAMHEARLPVAQRLGDLDSIAHIRMSMAQIRMARGELESGAAQTIHDELAEAFAISIKLGRPNAIGMTGFLLAHVLAMAGHRDEARSVLDQAEAGFAKIGDAAGLDDIRQLRERLNGGS